MKARASDPNCSGECLTAYDLGVDELGDMIAHAHPNCPTHGDPEEEA